MDICAIMRMTSIAEAIPDDSEDDGMLLPRPIAAAAVSAAAATEEACSVSI